MKIVFTDLDGTLFNLNSKISIPNLKTLYFLNRNDILNVAITGRNLYSANKVLDVNLPFDYLIFSTGIATMDFKTRKIFNFHDFLINKSHQIINFLLNKKLNFFVHQTVPDNHFFYYNEGNRNSDFLKRFQLYEKFAKKIIDVIRIGTVSQFVIVLDDRENYYFELKKDIEKNIDGIKIIRATSPLNHKNIWLEIYPQNVSKGNAAADLCKKLRIDLKDAVAIGNDYNDLELLQVAGKSYVVENAPEKLKLFYEVVSSNENNGFSEAVERQLNSKNIRLTHKELDG